MKSKEKIKSRSTFAILFYINRTKVRSDGTCQLLCRVSIDSGAQQTGTKIAVDPKVWNPETGRAMGRSRNALEVNRAIDALTDKITSHYERIRASLGFVTAELVKNAVKGVAQKPVSLLKLFEEHNEEFKRRVGHDRKIEAYQAYNLSYRHLKAYIEKVYEVGDISLRSLDLDFYDGYDLFLRTERGMQQKTVHQHLYNLKKMTKRAVSQGTLRRDPYLKLFPKLPRLKSRHLKAEELEKLMQYRPKKKNMEFVRDMFVFATFTGLCFADLKRLSDEHIQETPDGKMWIVMDRQKSGIEFRVRVMDIPRRIMEKYAPKRKDEHIFNLYCRETGQLGNLCGIPNLTFHRARHNFGTHITLSQGVPIESVSRMMGHKRFSTTQIYAKVTDTKVAEDMKLLAAKTSKRKISLYEDDKLRAAIRFPGANRNKSVEPRKTL
ncbi:MAG: site-specific integrase [Alistipes sp.]|nr:site-specific integrase [Alistipes sp.]